MINNKWQNSQHGDGGHSAVEVEEKQSNVKMFLILLSFFVFTWWNILNIVTIWIIYNTIHQHKDGNRCHTKTTRTLRKTQVCAKVSGKRKLHLLWLRNRRGIKIIISHIRKMIKARSSRSNTSSTFTPKITNIGIMF